MFQLFGEKQTLVCALKLKWDVANFEVVQKLTARTSGIRKLVKTQTVGTVRTIVTPMMNVKMKVVMKNENK